MRLKIRLDTLTDINQFVKKISELDENTKVCLEDLKGFRVSARSLLGVVYTVEWSEVYCMSDKDISFVIDKWIV